MRNDDTSQSEGRSRDAQTGRAVIGGRQWAPGRSAKPAACGDCRIGMAWFGLYTDSGESVYVYTEKERIESREQRERREHTERVEVQTDRRRDRE